MISDLDIGMNIAKAMGHEMPPQLRIYDQKGGTQAEQEQRRSHSPLKSAKINPLESLTDSVRSMLSTEDIKENKERLCALDNQSHG